MPKAKLFKLESDLCAAFIREAERTGEWTAYAETGGWDIVLVRKEDGFQIGFQAKLKLNALVLAQAIDQYDHADIPQPDCRAILVPWGECSAGLTYLCAYIGVTIVRVSGATTAGRGSRWRNEFSPHLPSGPGKDWTARQWFDMCPTARIKLPDYVPDVKAGSAAPLQLSDWKIRAIKLCLLLEDQGHVTRKDFSHLKLDHRLWLPSGRDWLKAYNGHYVAGRLLPPFQKQHPRAWEVIKADIEQWRPKTRSTEAGQPALL